MGIFDKFKIGFKKSASALTSGLKEIIVNKEIDDKNLNKIEELLIRSDVGVEAAKEIKEIISSIKIDPNKNLSNEINKLLCKIEGQVFIPNFEENTNTESDIISNLSQKIEKLRNQDSQLNQEINNIK